MLKLFAEWAHKRVRCELWGYSAEEDLNNEELIREKYQGIRPAPGYPSCPDHRLKLDIWQLLEVEKKHKFNSHRVFGNVAYC